MTGLSAKRFWLANRGLIREGYHADLVLFDPETVIDYATFEDPIQPSGGIESVWVGGRLAFSNGQSTEARSGRFVARDF